MPQQKKKFELKGKIKPALKIAGLAILAIIVVYIAFTFIGSLLSSMRNGLPAANGGYGGSYSGIDQSYDYGYKLAPGAAPMMDAITEMATPSLSTRNAASSAGYGSAGMSTGDNAEEFEMTRYDAQIETNQPDKTCAAIGALKARADVIFENASEYRRGCSYSFKVKRDKTGEILDIIKSYKPKELVNDTYTIQQQVQDYTSEIEILQNKLAVIDDTLAKAIAAYDEVTKLATSVKDAESLAKVINSKINTIEQLTQQRISINSQLDQIQRSKEQQLDRLDYAFFGVNVSDSGFIDWQSIGDSWNLAVKSALNQVNETIQNVSIALIAFLFILAQWLVYGFILLVVAKYVWKFAKKLWKK